VSDVLARIEYLDGSTQTIRLGLASNILTGLDHLLFVLALIFLIRVPRKLVKTINAFTIAPSLTLAGATLSCFSLPQKPVEAFIA
jgi:HupE / UreJ protein